MRRCLLAVALIIIPYCAYSKSSGMIVNEGLTEMESLLLSTGLMLISINTDNQEVPTCEYVSAPAGSMGQGITNATKIKGRIVVRKNEAILYDSGDYVEGQSGMTIKIRGNSSAYTDKKPYKIQLQQKADLLFRGDHYKDKSWVLLKDCEAFTLKDEMSMKPLIGGKVAELVGMEYVPQGRYVNVLLNDNYKGIYYLCENVKRNEKCRVDISKDNGYLFELDPYWWNEEWYFDTSITSTQFKYTFKEPDNDDLNDERIAYIREAVLEMEQSLQGETYPLHLDVSTFVKWILAHDILGTVDAGGTNKFFYKKDNTTNTLIKMGPLWDFDGIMKAGDNFPSIHTNNSYNFYFSQLFNSPYFVNCYLSEWKIVSATILDDLLSYLDDYSESEEGIALKKSREYEHEINGIEYNSVEGNVSFAKEYFTQRYVWLTKTINELFPNTNDISSQSISSESSTLYGIDGRFKSDKKGMYIENRRIYINY